MKCLNCNIPATPGATTDVTDLGTCLVIIRNAPCYKRPECNDIIYTGDVIRKLEKIIERAKKAIEENLQAAEF